MSRCHKAINPQEDSTNSADAGTSGLWDDRCLNNSELVLYMNSIPNRGNVILLFSIMSGVMIGIVCRKYMRVISGQLALSIGYLLFNELVISIELISHGMADM